MTPREVRAEIDARPANTATTRRFERSRRDLLEREIAASCALAGATFDRPTIRALIGRGATVAGSLVDHLTVLGYATAMLDVARQRLPQGRYLALAEIQRLHATIVRPLSILGSASPGAWRTQNVRPIREGMQVVPHWLIAFELERLVDRIGSGPEPGGEFRWLADAHERLDRIRPFASANGRVTRATIGLLLARCGFWPVAIDGPLVETYRAAQRAADRGDRTPLADMFERATMDGLEHVLAAVIGPQHLAPIATFAQDGIGLAALRKAAQRGRLRVLSKGGTLQTTAAWVAAYFERKSKAGRPALTRTPSHP